jgi:hypothetical protein
MSSVITILLGSIPKFSKYEKEETTHMILNMVSVLPQRNIKFS